MIKKTLKYFRKKTQPYKGYFWLMFVTRVIAAVLSMITPLLLKEIIDLMINNPDAQVSTVISTISTIVMRWIIVYAIERTMWRLFDIGIINLEINVIRDIYLQCYDYVQRHSHQFFANNFSGALVKKIGRLARGYEGFVDVWMFEFLPMLLTTVIGVVILFYQNSTIGFLFVGWLVIHVVVQVFLYNWKLKYDIKANEQDSHLTGHLSDAISNHMTINSFGTYKKEYQGLKKQLQDRRKAQRAAWRKHPVIGAIAGALIMATQVILVWYMVQGWKVGAITIGTILLIQMYVIRLFDRLMFIGNSIKRFYQMVSESAEMMEILETPHEVQDKHLKALEVHEGRIDFENIMFSYGENPIFNNLSFTIKPGEKVAFVGESGAGKSSIVKLLLRLYDIGGGKISIDNQDISEVTQESLRQMISYVPQDPVLFHRSLKENIAYGSDDFTDEQIIAASKMARCHGFITRLKDGYDTLVGERGVKLSGGERQRVAIARAILANKPILVMDEATSALDSESEKLIKEAMEEVMRNKTTIIIAHRLSTIMKMDRIVVMDKGSIVESGSHKELLLKSDGIYKKLRDIQSGGFGE